MEILSVNHETLSSTDTNDLYILRKNVFKDRLDWAVKCSGNMEFDEYDNQYATYIMAVHDDLLLGSLRMIDMKHPTLFTGPFRDYFDLNKLPKGKHVECSRSFVDKENSRILRKNKYPVSTMLYLSALNYSMKNNYDSIVAIVGYAKLKIIERTGWKVNVIEEMPSEKNEPIFFSSLPVDKENQERVINNLNKNNLFENEGLTQWPIKFNRINERKHDNF